jgi:hypothetical protein
MAVGILSPFLLVVYSVCSVEWRRWHCNGHYQLRLALVPLQRRKYFMHQRQCLRSHVPEPHVPPVRLHELHAPAFDVELRVPRESNALHVLRALSKDKLHTDAARAQGALAAPYNLALGVAPIATQRLFSSTYASNTVVKHLDGITCPGLLSS